MKITCNLCIILTYVKHSILCKTFNDLYGRKQIKYLPESKTDKRLEKLERLKLILDNPFASDQTCSNRQFNNVGTKKNRKKTKYVTQSERLEAEGNILSSIRIVENAKKREQNHIFFYFRIAPD